MKISKKLLSLFLSVIIAASAAIPGVRAVNENDYLLNGESEAPTFTTKQFLEIYKPIVTALRLLTGREFFLPQNTIDFEFNSEQLNAMLRYINENSGLDMVSLVENLPLGAKGLNFVYEITNADTEAIRNAVYELRDKADEVLGAGTPGLLLHILGAYLSIIEKCEIFTVPYGNDGSIQVCITAYFKDGASETIPLEMYFSPDGKVYGKNSSGFLGLGYDFSTYDLLVCATVNCWMRNMGFCLFYDIFCYLTPFFNYTTRRYKFDYDGKEWMVQVWKGNYLVTNGAEVGIYNRDEKKIGSYYDCYDSTMPMTLTLKYGDDVIFDVSQEHWWVNGFKLGLTMYDPDAMTAEYSITFPDEGMANAYADSVEKNYRHDSTCTVNGTTVVTV